MAKVPEVSIIPLNILLNQLWICSNLNGDGGKNLLHVKLKEIFFFFNLTSSFS